MPRLVLLIKSIKPSLAAGFALYGSPARWHKVHKDKPAPHGAPVLSAVPEGEQLHEPDKMLTPEMWSQIFDHPANTNQANFHKKLDKLKEAFEAGDADAILAGNYPADTTHKKLAKVGNYLLGLLGSEHTIAIGQKKGEHPGVGKAAAPADVAAPVEPVAQAVQHEQVNIEAQQAADAPPSVEPEAPNTADPIPTADPVTVYQAKKDAQATPTVQHDGEDWYVQSTGVTSPDGTLVFAHLASKTEGKPQKNGFVPKQIADWVKKNSISDPAAVPMPSSGDIVMPAFVEGKTTTGVVDYYQEQAQKVIDMAAAGDTVGLVEMKTEGLKPNAKGKVSNTWAGKTANSKKLMALHDDALGQALDATDNEAPGAVFAPDPAPVPEPVAVAPEPAPEPVAAASPTHPDIPKFQDLNHQIVAKKWIKLVESGDGEAAKVSVTKLAESMAANEKLAGDTDTKKLLLFGFELLSGAGLVSADKAAIVSQMKAAEEGSKEGDTKQGADGMLVLKDGHWVKVEADQPAEAVPAGLDAIAIPDFSDGTAWGDHYAKIATALLEKVKAEGANGLKGVVVNHATGQVTVKIAGFQVKKISESSLKDRQVKLAKFVAELKAAVGKPKKAPKAKAAPVPPPAAPYQPGVESMDGWKQTGPQGGSNPGGKFVDDQGAEWYCKFPGDDDVAKSEVLAARLYAAAGVAGQDAKLISKDGKLGIASKWTEVSKLTPAKLAKADGAASGFAVDAWLGNWDVVGMGYDNLQVGPDGKAVRIDAGGSLEYRAQGGKKAFGPHVVEIDSLRDAKINHQSAAVFGKMSTADVTASVSKVLGVSDAKIHALVHAYGPGDAAAKQKMIDTLIARKADLAEKFPKAKKEKKAKVFNSDAISSPPSFMNWGGSGKSGPSSKEFLNAANENAVQSIYEAAKTGSIEAVQSLSAAIYNKESGDVSGSAPVLEHPSQHVKGYAQQAINELNYQLHPPKRFRFEGGHPLHSLNSAYPSHKGPLHGSVSKVGKFILLGEPGTISLDTLALPKHTYQSGAITTATFSPAAKASIKSMPETQKQAIKAYTGSSYHAMNTSLWSGNPTGAAKSAGEALHALGHDITPGTVLSRKISVSGADLDQILKSTGKVLQEPAIMSTSIRPSSWSGNVQLKMHVGPGVKGLWVGKGSVGSNGALSNHSGEDELILPPNTRLLILSVKSTAGADADGFGATSQHVIEAVILPTQASA